MRLACLWGQPYAGSQQGYLSQHATILAGSCIRKRSQELANTLQQDSGRCDAAPDPDDVRVKSVSAKRSLVCIFWQGSIRSKAATSDCACGLI